MFSETAYKNADACRFCWMCRHLCPVALVTGKEINSARAKGLMVSMIKRGEEYDASMAEDMWECCLCGSCANNCATGYDPRLFIREARSLAVAEGLAPKKVAALAEAMLPEGLMYGGQALPESLEKRLAGLPERAETLLLIGQVARHETPELALAAMELLDRAGADWTALAAEPDSGAYLGDMIGYVDETRKLAGALGKAIDGSGAKTVIALDPMDARMLKHKCTEWNCAPKAEVFTATSYFAALTASGALRPEKTGGVCAIHDSGALCRDLGETAPVRAIAAALGLEIHELLRSVELSKSSGGALLPKYAGELSLALAKARWDELLRSDARLLVTEAPGSYAALRQCVPEGCGLEDILTLLAGACR